jgi:hypothetical protein
MDTPKVGEPSARGPAAGSEGSASTVLDHVLRLASLSDGLSTRGNTASERR